jgi:hypothetical protein
MNEDGTNRRLPLKVIAPQLEGVWYEGYQWRVVFDFSQG